MQNMNKFPQQHMYSVGSVHYWNQDSMFDGNYTVLRNPYNTIQNNPIQII